MSFERAIEFVLSWEKEWADDPRDRGGRTRWGIASRAHPDVDLDTLTREGAISIYREEYWRPIRGDELPAGIDLALFDWAVNSGVATAVENVQAIVLPGQQLPVVLGPKTLGAIRAADPRALLRAITQARADDRVHQGFTHDQRAFLKGWIRRVLACGLAAAEQLEPRQVA